MLSYSPEIVEELIKTQDRFVWEAPFFQRRERSSAWYLIMSGVCLLLIAYAIWTQNFLFAFLIVLIALLVLFTSRDIPRTVLAQIGHNGIVWNGTLHPFEGIQSFAILYNPPVQKILYIRRNGWITPEIAIPLEDQDPVEIREHLRQYLAEDLDLQKEPWSDKVTRLLKL